MKVGEQAFDFTRLDQNGKELTLSELPRPILLVFLGSWRTPPVRDNFKKRLPSLLEAHDKGVSVVCVSTNYINVNQEIAKELEVPFPMLDDNSNTDAMMAYQQQSLKHNNLRYYPICLIDKNFIVSYLSKEDETLEEMLALPSLTKQS